VLSLEFAARPEHLPATTESSEGNKLAKGLKTYLGQLKTSPAKPKSEHVGRKLEAITASGIQSGGHIQLHEEPAAPEGCRYPKPEGAAEFDAGSRVGSPARAQS
jgi:hypothetical protein